MAGELKMIGEYYRVSFKGKLEKIIIKEMKLERFKFQATIDKNRILTGFYFPDTDVFETDNTAFAKTNKGIKNVLLTKKQDLIEEKKAINKKIKTITENLIVVYLKKEGV